MMDRHTSILLRLAMLLLVATLVLGIGFALAQTQSAAQTSGDTPKSAQVQAAEQPSGDAPGSAAEKPAETPETPAADAAAAEDATAGRTVSRMRNTTRAQREAAARRAINRRADLIKRGVISEPAAGTIACSSIPLGTPCVQVDYFSPVPNYALSSLPTSGGIRKFRDTLAGLGPANHSSLGTNIFIPVASPKTNLWDSTSDYYEIGLKQYTQQFHSDLPATTQVRGYYDLNTSPLAAFGNSSDTNPHYLGPVIIAQRSRPVRVKFTNNIPAGQFFFIPADISYMGMTNTDASNHVTNYSPNRGTIHLHGGATPWISDGTPYQWTAPGADATTYKRGASVQFVPDMWFDDHGNVVQADEDEAIYVNVLKRTFGMSAVVTAFCLLLGFPLAYLMATQPPEACVATRRLQTPTREPALALHAG